MASFVYICNLEDRNTAAGWEKTRYKSVAKWIAGTGATEEPIRSDSRPGLTTFCYKLPDGRQFKAEQLDEGTMVEYRDWDRALGSIVDYIANKKWPVRWRAKALGDAVKAERAKGAAKTRGT